MRSIAYLSAAALAIYLVIIFSVVYYGIIPREHSDSDGDNAIPPINWADFSNIGVWFGVNVFAFEGIGVVLAVHESMRLADPGPFYRVLHAVYAICTVLYSFVAVFGYIT
jgi:amino acid permease